MNVSQADFHAGLLDPAREIPPGLSDGLGRAAGRRYSVYRNNVTVSLTEALELGFPAIAKLLGDRNFRNVARQYLRAHPPRTPIMMQYGAEFPAFLASFEPLAHLGYLGDVARLEAALRVSYHAADADPVAADALEGLSPEALAAARFDLAPAVRLLHSRWPVHQIWRYTLEDGVPKPAGGGESVLITRPGFDPVATPIAPVAAKFVAALQEGRSLTDAHDAAAGDDVFDMAGTLGLLLAGQAIIHISPGDPTCAT